MDSAFIFVVFFSLVNFLFSISGRQEPRPVLSGQTPGSVAKCQILELSANECGGWVVAEATADLGRRVLEMWGLFCCLSPASRSESSKEELAEGAPGKDLRGPRGPTAQHCTPGTACTAAPDSQSRCCSCHQAILVKKSSFAGCRPRMESLNALRTGKAAAAAEEDAMPGEKPSG